MRWEDEHYVKLYTRDTPTWMAMGWQARALLGLLLRKLDKAGLLECGELGRSAIALMVGLPEEVVTPGMAALERFGVVVWHPNGTLEMPKFEDAQEARASDLIRKREQRARDRAKARSTQKPQVPETSNDASHGVTRGHEMSHEVTPRHPSPDIPAQTSQTKIPVAAEKPAATDPRLTPLLRVLEADFAELRGAKYKHGGVKDTQALKALLSIGTDEEIRSRWRRGLNGLFSEEVNSIAQLGSKWNALTPNKHATGPPKPKAPKRMEPMLEIYDRPPPRKPLPPKSEPTDPLDPWPEDQHETP